MWKLQPWCGVSYECMCVIKAIRGPIWIQISRKFVDVIYLECALHFWYIHCGMGVALVASEV